MTLTRETTSGYTDEQIETMNRAISQLSVFAPRMGDETRAQAQNQAEQWVLEQYDNDLTQTPEQIAYAVADRFGWR